MSLTDEGHYGPKQLNMLKTVWGEGFLSPGGKEEIDEILKGIDLTDKKVLDFGCGTGGAVFHMIEKHNAAEVTGIDPEPLVIETANKLAREKGISSKVNFICAAPGILEFKQESFDIIFSKEAFLHVPDKKILLTELGKILIDDGIIAVGDWMRNDDQEPSDQMKEYIAAEGLDMYMCSLNKYSELLEETGFSVISLNDRNQWYLEVVQKEISDIKGPLYDQVINLIGKEEADGALKIWEQLLGVVKKGEHRPGNFQAIKKRK